MTKTNREFPDEELGRYRDPAGVEWRVMKEFGEGCCWLECHIDGEWKVLCDTGSLDSALKEGLSTTEAVKEYVDMEIASRSRR